MRMTYIVAATTATAVATLPMPMVQRAPYSAPIQPISGLPNGVPPMKIAI